MTATATRASIVKDYARQEGDTGSPEVQIALLTNRILTLTDHVRTHRHDHHSRRGLIMMVGQRNRLLRYIARTDNPKYQTLIKRLGLRK